MRNSPRAGEGEGVSGGEGGRMTFASIPKASTASGMLEKDCSPFVVAMLALYEGSASVVVMLLSRSGRAE